MKKVEDLPDGVLRAPWIMLLLRERIVPTVNEMVDEYQKLEDRVNSLEKIVVKLGEKETRSRKSRKVDKKPAES